MDNKDGVYGVWMEHRDKKHLHEDRVNIEDNKMLLEKGRGKLTEGNQGILERHISTGSLGDSKGLLFKNRKQL